VEFITTRNFALPDDKGEMESSEWFNMWKRKNFPYNELLVGDTTYWFDRKKQVLLWKTSIVMVDRFPYDQKSQILERYPNYDESSYFVEGPDSGYFITYRVKVDERLSVPRPPGFQFPQLGWAKVDDVIAHKWFERDAQNEETTLDASIDTSSSNISDILQQLNDKMRDVSPERIRRVVAATIRKDGAIVKALKQSLNYQCQFPNCGITIKTKNGGHYIEVAHIEPVKSGGKSVLGNLLVLCPNHHKEFDFGRLEIIEQTNERLTGILNDKEFSLNLTV
jgi:hypothetical protein